MSLARIPARYLVQIVDEIAKQLHDKHRISFFPRQLLDHNLLEGNGDDVHTETSWC